MTDWTDKLTPRERVQAVVETLPGPTTVDDIAEEANVPTDDAANILEDLSTNNGIARQVDENQYDVDLAELESRMCTDDP